MTSKKTSRVGLALGCGLWLGAMLGLQPLAPVYAQAPAPNGAAAPVAPPADAAKPDGAKPDAAKPDAPKVEAPKQETPKTGAEAPKAPDAAKPDAKPAADAGKPAAAPEAAAAPASALTAFLKPPEFTPVAANPPLKETDAVPACAAPVAADVPAIKDAKGAIISPALKKNDGILSNCTPNSGDTAWMLTAMALVLMMTIPGLGLFYGGMVRKKNVGDTVMTSFAICCLVTVIFACVTYTLSFTSTDPSGSGGSAYLGGFSRLFLQGIVSNIGHGGIGTPNSLAPTIPEVVYMAFQMTFAIITPALIAGAFAERMKFSAMLWFIGLWSVLVYAPVAHWVWHGDGFLNATNTSKTSLAHVLDYAGGTVVHINAGIAGLVCAIMLGKRKETGPGHNMVLTFIGAGLLWVGWFGFNAGSAVSAGVQAGMAMTVTQLATGVAALVWMFVEWAHRGRPTVIGIASGAVAGLVAITPASGFVGPIGAMAIGVAAGAFCYFGATGLKHMFGYDDALDCFGVHGVGGIVGALLTGIFAVESYGGFPGLLEGHPEQFVNQCIGVGIVIVYDLVMSVVILTVVKLIIGLRVDEETERDGLDLALHAEVVH